MPEGLLSALERVETLAREIREREHELDEAIARAHELDATQRQIASWAGTSPSTVNRKLARRATPEEAAELVAVRAEAAQTRLALAKVALAKKQLALGHELDAGDVDEIVEEALSVLDQLDVRGLVDVE